MIYLIGSIVCLLFLFGSAVYLGQPRFRLLIIGVLFVFTGFIYWFLFETMGLPRPMQYNIAGYDWLISNRMTVDTAFIDTKIIYLVLTDEKNETRLYSFKKTENLEKKLQQAMSDFGGYGFKMNLVATRGKGGGSSVLDTDYGSYGASSFDGGAAQANTAVGKELLKEDGVKNLDAPRVDPKVNDPSLNQ